MSNRLTVVSDMIDQCSKEQFKSVFSPLADLPLSSTISYSLNKELGAYGLNTYTSPDKTMVLVNDETVCKVIDFFNNKGYQPGFTNEQINRIKTIAKVADNNKVDILWAQSGILKKYYYFKQYGFNGVNLYNALTINTINSAAASLSVTGAAGLSMAGVVALSWTSSLLFSTLENYIPNSMPRVKIAVSGTKFVTALPIRCVEWTSNQMIGLAENVIFGHALPTNITEVYKLNVGPKLKEIEKLKKPILNWLVKKWENWNS